MKLFHLFAAAALIVVAAGAARAQDAAGPVVNPLKDTSVYPIAVWAMGAQTAPAFSKMGVNIFVGDQGNSKTWCDQIAKSKCVGFVNWSPGASEAQRKAIASSPGFLGWMHGDEPDNPGEVNGEYRPYHVLPSTLLDAYKQMKASSTPAPMYLNLGQGLANANAQTTPDGVYPEFCQAADILCYDIYPTSTQEDGANRLALVARGVQRLRKFAGPDRPVWIWLECTRLAGDKSAIGNRCPLPHELRAEIWMSILYGADGIGYFPHQFDPYLGGPAAIPENIQTEMTLTDNLLHKFAPILRTGKKEMLKVDAGTGFVSAAAWQKDGKALVVVVNMKNEAAQAKLISPLGGDSLALNLKPYEVALYYPMGVKVSDYDYPAPPAANVPNQLAHGGKNPGALDAVPIQRDNRKGVHWSRTQNTRIVIPELTEAPTIDGDLSDKVWTRAQEIDNFTNTAGTGVAGIPTICRIGRFGGKIYLAFRCEEPLMKDLVTNKAAAWQNDCVEFWFDPHNTRTSFAHFVVTAAGKAETSRTVPDENWPAEARRDDGWKPAVECQAGRTGSAWTVEVALDLKDLGDPQKNPVWGFDAARERRPGTAENSVWTIGGFNAPHNFGEATFEPATVTLANGTLYNWTDKEQAATVEVLLSGPESGNWFPTWEDRWLDLARQSLTYRVPPAKDGKPGELNLLGPDLAPRVPKAGRVRLTLQSPGGGGPKQFEELIANPWGAVDKK